MRQFYYFLGFLSIIAVPIVLHSYGVMIIGKYTANGVWIGMICIAYTRILSITYLIYLAAIWSIALYILL